MDKETLQKKIESGDTVWYLWRFANHIEARPLSLLEDEDNKICITCAESLYHAYKTLDGWHNEYYSIDELFATKEEAEWKLEFGNITRTEKLELPTWEQFKKDKCFTFFGIDWTFYELHNRRRNKLQLDYSYDNDYYRPEKEWKLTYENYLEACRICKKLFLGEVRNVEKN